jgi:LacI family transcriptional regulator
MAITIKDVAREAGFSLATVSRALNGADNILPATKQRIVEVADRLRYSPSGAARSLITRRTDTIGALLPDLHGEYFSELIRGMDRAAHARKLHLLVSSSHGNGEEAAAALRAMAGRVDGLLVMSPHADAGFLEHNLAPGLPAVLINTAVENSTYPTFVVDNFAGATMMTRHLLEAGRQRVAFICGPDENREAQERLAGYRSALAGAFGRPRHAPAECVLAGDFTEQSGWEAGQRIAAMSPRPDAVFAANDMTAVGCLAALRAAGLRVPEDIALGGFDDIPIARYVSPALTTIRVPIFDLGATALDALAESINLKRRPEGRATAHSTALAVHLVIRQSCGAELAGKQPSKKRTHTHPTADDRRQGRS